MNQASAQSAGTVDHVETYFSRTTGAAIRVRCTCHFNRDHTARTSEQSLTLNEFVERRAAPAAQEDGSDAIISHESPLDGLDPIVFALPANVRTLLHSARVMERQTVGSARRDAQRNSRVIISGLLAAGIPSRLIATELNVKPSSVRTRAQPGTIDPDQFAQLTGVAASELLSRCTSEDLDSVTGGIRSSSILRLLL